MYLLNFSILNIEKHKEMALFGFSRKGIIKYYLYYVLDCISKI